MPKKIDNLWPDFEKEPRPRTVRRALLEAGAGLGEQTANRIQFEVVSEPTAKGKFAHNCYLFAPALSFRYPLCKVTEDGDPYPVTLMGEGTPRDPHGNKKGAVAGDEDTFMENLRRFFHAEPTKQAVLRLLDILS